MATRPSKGHVQFPYSVLHNLRSVDLLYDDEKKKPTTKTLDSWGLGVFEAGRFILARRKV